MLQEVIEIWRCSLLRLRHSPHKFDISPPSFQLVDLNSQSILRDRVRGRQAPHVAAEVSVST